MCHAVALASAMALCTAAGSPAAPVLSAEYIERNSRSMWEAFKVTHQKKYAEPSEEERRFGHFKASMQRAAEHQRRNPLASFGPSPYADLSEDEWARKVTGLQPISEKERQKEPPILHASLYSSTRAEKLAAKNMDWRHAGVVTNVKNQGKCGGCWSFSAIGAIEGAWARALHPLTSLSEQFLLSCARGSAFPTPFPWGGDFDDPEWTAGSCAGGNPYRAFQWLLGSQAAGRLVTEASYPYEEVGCNPDAGCATNACRYESSMKWGATITGKQIIVPNSEQTEPAMLVALEDYGPVSIGVDADVWQTYTGGIITDCPAGQVGHGVLLVGYGTDAQTNTRYWLIKNSWGPSWGESGYVRIAYGTNACSIRTMPTIPLVAAPGAVPAVVHVPQEIPMVPAVMPAPEPEPFWPPAHGQPGADTPAPGTTPTVCVSGDDCKCENDHLHFLGLDGKKVGPDVCAAALVVAGVAALVFFLLGCLIARCCCPGSREPKGYEPIRASPPRSRSPSPQPSPASSARPTPRSTPQLGGVQAPYQPYRPLPVVE
eukprot:TRINITY_DN39341_c1_g1_i1.p1 TRINITY_DN39341_c1_g1~~TRINITY_DN39341_c1_g1_i1.p1  ORF type:complete len:543 (+),score=91.82 TRINITY_DN39341_c1_g1_i1:89-1717(+)